MRLFRTTCIEGIVERVERPTVLGDSVNGRPLELMGTLVTLRGGARYFSPSYVEVKTGACVEIREEAPAWSALTDALCSKTRNARPAGASYFCSLKTTSPPYS